MKTKTLSVEVAKKLIKDKPSRQVGKWKEICDAVKEKRFPIEVSDITRGQVAALARKARAEGLEASTWYKEGKCIVSLAEAE